jgi:hypothetical protein
MMRPRRLPLTLLALGLALAVAPPASAASSLEVGIADDGVTQRTPALAPQVIPAWKRAGADVARLLVVWQYVAPANERLTAPAGFDPANPNDPAYNWAPVDQAVDLLRAQGIEPILNLTGWSPLWGTKDPSQRDVRLNPDPKQFAVFAKAAAQRYAGRVDRYILWNEPNFALWLKPQFDCTGGRCTPNAPHQYREIARQAVPAIKAGDPGAVVYGPALAAAGQSPTSRNKNMRPLAFLRALGCVSATYRADRSGRCRSFTPATLDGIAYHPHSRALAPDRGYPHPDDANLSQYGRLTTALDRIQARGGLLNAGSKTRRFDLFYDEWGYQTNPPDPIIGITPQKQSDYLQWGAYLAYKQPRVKMLVQYLWRDDPLGAGSGTQRYSGWQSGLYSFDGRAKPAAATFPHPFWVDLPRGRRSATVWGQVRPGGATPVTVQRRLAGSSSWRTLATLSTSARGFFTLKTTVNAKASFRFRYAGASGATVTSATRTVQPRG